MSDLTKLKAITGIWEGTNRLYDPHTNAPDETSSKLNLASILNGRFVRADYTWSYQGKPQEGSMLIGFDADENVVTMHWIDTWHMSNKVMALKGTSAADGTVQVIGSYAAPPDPDWAWRIMIKPDAKSLKITMYNISPQGEEYPAVEASYKKS
jgi:Protein of unknown function (DUF1579)